MNIEKILAVYRRYTQGEEKKELDGRILENNRWYRQQYTEYQSREEAEREKNQPPARSGYIFSAITNKHADAMDNYPDVTVLPREVGDAEEAKRLTSILPCVMELAGFRETYSGNWWYKLKNGTAVYGVFWNPEAENGLGDIEIKKIDLLNLAWQPGVSDLQDSKYVFYSYYMDKDEFVSKYGKEKLAQGQEVTLETYRGKNYSLLEEMVLVVDCYYKIRTGGRTCVHLVKFSGEHILEQTEGKSAYEGGVYAHGMYPFVFDVLYPNEDSPAGFGVIDVVKGPQAYIDKLDALISENSLIVGKTRYFIRDNGGVNENEYLDLSQPLVHVAGSLDERNIMPITAQALPQQITEQRDKKINELKEVIGNRDFQQGGTSGGVTAASAITVLQQAGDKLSRDMIAASYSCYRKIVILCIELIRQFYDAPRRFRITGDSGSEEFVSYDNTGLAPQPVGFMEDWESEPIFRRPEFDVTLAVQKSNPFTKELQNQTIMQLWNAGFFNPQTAPLALIALENMQFEGRDKIIEKLREMVVQQQAQATQAAQAAQMGASGFPQSEALWEEGGAYPKGHARERAIAVPTGTAEHSGLRADVVAIPINGEGIVNSE